ncbi:MAG: YicC family protein [Proteobacteria bacterium]|nr:YicC family protein [Pseudomonadota bacterium]
MRASATSSMTGFARAEGQAVAAAPFTWTWEARSVNSKSLDVRLRLPHGFDSIEIPARQAVTAAFARGSISLNLTVASETPSGDIGIDETALDALIALAARKTAQFGAVGQTVAPARLDGLMALAKGRTSQETTVAAETLAARDAALLKGLNAALTALAAARGEEGARLLPVLKGHLDTVTALCRQAEAHAATQPTALRDALIAQLRDLAGEVPALSPERLAQEAALLAVKADVREELDRLKAHVIQAHELLAKGEPCGRRLDFLSQEFNREANTLCSKSADVSFTKIGLDLKTVIDQFREQIQNIE